MNHLYQGDCLEVLKTLKPVTCIFADPPDNIGLGYDSYDDRLADEKYKELLHQWMLAFMRDASIVWVSFNAKWTFAMGKVFEELLACDPEWEGKACTQVFTFGQHNKHDLGNNHRPLWRLRHKSAPLYPDAIKVPSWRQRNGDKRAAEGGRVPGDVFDMQYPTEWADKQRYLEHMEKTFGVSWASGAADAFRVMESRGMCSGDVFDFPRVTGNSKQRCDWHPTQLHEELVERCIRLSTQPDDTVLDPFGGTGTTLRVCNKIGRDCTLIELDPAYCKKIAEANGMGSRKEGHWCSL